VSAWVCGWDIGGAHLKFALRDPLGRWIETGQLPCPLWQGIERLTEALRLAVRDWPVPPQQVHHAATMTGELVDAFAGRAAGVAAIVDCSESVFPGAAWRWFTVDDTLVDAAEAHRRPLALASANWLVSAACAARQVEGLFIDIGSTTTDIVALAGGMARPRGLTDGERLSAGELVYRGLVRTPLMAVAASIDWRGSRRPLMAEHFATSADVFRLTGDLDEAADAWPAADAGEKTVAGSARRIARLLGEDLESATLDEWRDVAGQFAEAIVSNITASAVEVLRSVEARGAGADRVGGTEPPSQEGRCVVCAGAGHGLAARVAARLGLPAEDFASLIGAAGVPGAREHAPAFALAARLSNALAPHRPAG
jgi:probable H4MPT-linked C1 transfer pathway protein